jgi:hypothetical protein
VTGHYGHEDSDLAVEALTAVKIAQHRVELTWPGKRPGSVCQQAHPLRERKRSSSASNLAAAERMADIMYRCPARNTG